MKISFEYLEKKKYIIYKEKKLDYYTFDTNALCEKTMKQQI